MFLKLHTSEITLIQIYSRNFFFSYNRFYVLVEVVKAHIDGKIIVEQKQKKKLIVVQTNRLHGRVARVQLTGSKMTWKAWGNFSRFQPAKKMMIMTTTMEKKKLNLILVNHFFNWFISLAYFSLHKHYKQWEFRKFLRHRHEVIG